MTYQDVSVLGCGFLGLPLASYLVSKGYRVKGSTTTPTKITTLQTKNIKPYLLISKNGLVGEELDQFFQSQVLFLNIPFRRDFENPKIYFEEIKSIVDYVKKSTINFVVFASSTAVYPDTIGEAREETPFVPSGARAKVLREIEKYLLNQKEFKGTIIRFAGLYGQERRIGKFLAGKTELADPEAPVNLIHIDDCVRIVALVIERNIQNEILNASSDAHPTRRELYTNAAKKMNLPPPEFLNQSSGANKIVSNQKLKNLLKYQFVYPDPLKTLDTDDAH